MTTLVRVSAKGGELKVKTPAHADQLFLLAQPSEFTDPFHHRTIQYSGPLPSSLADD
jgi:hypothetical protein